MTTAKRSPIESLSPYTLTWTTEFNDLRPTLPPTTVARLALVMLELKTHALFNESTLVRDTDLVCNAELMQILAEDLWGAQAAVRHHAIRLCIRDQADSFAHVNEIMHTRRSFEEHYHVGTTLLPRIDDFIANSPTELPSIRIGAAPTAFSDNLTVLLETNYLLSEGKDKLREAIRYAAKRESGSLRLGDINDYLFKHGETPHDSDLVQWCRAAHSLIVPASLGLPVSTADSDLGTEKAALFLHGDVPLPRYQAADPDLFPRRILTDAAMKSLSFEQIVSHRSSAVGRAYFEMMANVRRAASQSRRQLEHCFSDYLRILADYIEAIGMEYNVDLELVDWQAARLDKLDWWEKLRFTSYPVALAGGVLVTMGLGAMGVAIEAATPAALAAWRINQSLARTDTARKQLLRGHTTTMPPGPVAT